MSELETELGAALRSRSHEITEVTLLRPQLGAPAVPGPQGARSPRRTLLAVAAAACVLAIVGAGLIGRAVLGRDSTHPAATTAASAYVGYKWQLISVQHTGAATPVPRSYRATVEFSRDGKLLMSDTVNALFGDFRVTRDGFSTDGLGTTDVGYAGTDALRLRVIQAIDAIGTRVDGAAGPVAVHAVTTGGRLTLVVGGYTMVFDRAAPATVSTSVSPTPTRTS